MPTQKARVDAQNDAKLVRSSLPGQVSPQGNLLNCFPEIDCPAREEQKIIECSTSKNVFIKKLEVKNHQTAIVNTVINIVVYSR